MSDVSQPSSTTIACCAPFPQEGSLFKFKSSDVPILLFMGVIGVAIPQSLTFLANQMSSPDVVALMAPAGPVSSKSSDAA